MTSKICKHCGKEIEGRGIGGYHPGLCHSAYLREGLPDGLTSQEVAEVERLDRGQGTREMEHRITERIREITSRIQEGWSAKEEASRRVVNQDPVTTRSYVCSVRKDNDLKHGSYRLAFDYAGSV